MMLARVADSLYWIGRYIERAEHISRVAYVMLNASLDQSDDAADAARIGLSALGRDFTDEDLHAPFEAIKAIVFDRKDPGSVVTALALARENARQVRDQITTEMWEQLNGLYLEMSRETSIQAFEQVTANFLSRIPAGLHTFKGAVEATMSHGEGWRFLSMGVHLERAQLIASLLDAAFGEGSDGEPVDDHLVQMSILRMCCAQEPYLRVYTSDLQIKSMLEFLLLNDEFPRSVRYATAQMEEHSQALSRHADTRRSGSEPERLAGRLSSRLEFADPEELTGDGTADILNTVAAECARIHEAVHETFVDYPIEQRLPA